MAGASGNGSVPARHQAHGLFNKNTAKVMPDARIPNSVIVRLDGTPLFRSAPDRRRCADRPDREA
jgi:hypothetical protein